MKAFDLRQADGADGPDGPDGDIDTVSMSEKVIYFSQEQERKIAEHSTATTTARLPTTSACSNA